MEVDFRLYSFLVLYAVALFLVAVILDAASPGGGRRLLGVLPVDPPVVLSAACSCSA